MALNIKNQVVCDLAEEAASLTGQNKTSVIEEALRLLLAEHERKSTENQAAERKKRVIALLDEARTSAPVYDGPYGEDAILTDHDLYDSVTGLPR